ncbi:transcriptional regulator [Flavobacterium sp.]|uniref:transcriptional regulator n=1 Tax=Flavobacterium sp. TaxID=239 RepID=UPI00286E7E05|nr:transcriptional regulator [Flavobacterium sp.]
MNYIKHLTGFFEKVAIDRTLNPTHVSLYMSLFQFWNCNRFKNPISINRDEVMRISKISSKATYHKCLKNLHSLGYLNYEPSYNPFKGSHVYLFNFSDDLKPTPKSEKTTIPNNEPVFELVNEQVVNKSCTSAGTSSGTGTEQALVSYINNTNIPNISNDLKIVNLDEQAKKFQIDDNVIARNDAICEKIKEEKSSAKKEEKEIPEDLLIENSRTSFPAFADPNAKQTQDSRQKSSAKKEKELTPTIENVKAYFLEQHFPELEANKFFNYFSSIGWLVGGKSPMVDWKAAAQNWMLNANKFNPTEILSDRAKHLNTGTDKDYSEPL